MELHGILYKIPNYISCSLKRKLIMISFVSEWNISFKGMSYPRATSSKWRWETYNGSWLLWTSNEPAGKQEKWTGLTLELIIQNFHRIISQQVSIWILNLCTYNNFVILMVNLQHFCESDIFGQQVYSTRRAIHNRSRYAEISRSERRVVFRGVMLFSNMEIRFVEVHTAYCISLIATVERNIRETRDCEISELDKKSV